MPIEVMPCHAMNACVLSSREHVMLTSKMMMMMPNYFVSSLEQRFVSNQFLTAWHYSLEKVKRGIKTRVQ